MMDNEIKDEEMLIDDNEFYDELVNKIKDHLLKLDEEDKY